MVDLPILVFPRECLSRCTVVGCEQRFDERALMPPSLSLFLTVWSDKHTVACWTFFRALAVLLLLLLAEKEHIHLLLLG